MPLSLRGFDLRFLSIHASSTRSIFEQKSELGASGKNPSATASAKQTEDILNAILPPREFEDSAALWVQRVTSAPATRMDVITLQERLDALLNERQARETGICPVREELYAQCFDELIRQVTVTCAERGLLLLRVRDELRMSIMAYQTLYESSVAFGMRKALQTEQGKSEMAETIDAQRRSPTWSGGRRSGARSARRSRRARLSEGHARRPSTPRRRRS